MLWLNITHQYTIRKTREEIRSLIRMMTRNQSFRKSGINITIHKINHVNGPETLMHATQDLTVLGAKDIQQSATVPVLIMLKTSNKHQFMIVLKLNKNLKHLRRLWRKLKRQPKQLKMILKKYKNILPEKEILVRQMIQYQFKIQDVQMLICKINAILASTVHGVKATNNHQAASYFLHL